MLRRTGLAIRIAHYVIAVALVGGSCLLRWAMPQALSGTPYVAFFPAVAIAAMLGGLGPGLLATVLSLCSVRLLFDHTPWPLELADPGKLIRRALFLASGITVSLIAQRVRSAQHRQLQQRQSEEAARAYLAAIVESSDDAILSTDLSGTIRSWNAAAERLLGYRAEEIVDQPIARLLPPEYTHLEDEILRALRAGRRVEHLETVRLTKAGCPVEVWVTASPVKDASGQVVGAATILRDITERKQTQSRLQLQAGALKAAANGIVLTDAQGTILWANPAFAAMTGYAVEEVIGRNPRILKSGRQDPALYRSLWETICRGQPWHGELVNRRKDDTFYDEEMTITPLRDEHGKISNYIAIKQDVTQRKAREAELAEARISAEQAQAAAEQANAAKDHFLAVLSHELRTPLTAVLPALEALEPMLEGDGRELLEMVHRNVEVEARLIDDLLDVTRIARGKVELERRPVPLGAILQRAAEVCMPDIEARRLHFAMKIEGGPHFVDADAARLQQVFWNLIKNAVKFTPHDGRVGVRASGQEGSVVVEVSDTGVGIEPRSLTRIFHAFEQADRCITRQFGGLGLGLAISKTLVELHDGTISAHSEGKGRGATFTVRLPLASLPLETNFGPAAPGRESAGENRKLKILLVEDHGDTARILQRLLRAAGNQVEYAADVATALQLAATQTFDLILSDLGLPDASGVDLMRELRARGDTTPGIALSGYGQEEDIRRSREAGFALHLTKPASPRRLTAAIAAVTEPRSHHAMT